MRIALALLFATAAAAQTQYQWHELSTQTPPFARERHAMAFDDARGETVLFGGNNGAYMNDTWVLGASGWTRRQPASSPSARCDHAMAYDPVRQRVVLLGGYDGTELHDVWEWDGSSWTQAAGNVNGIGRNGAACHDPLQGGVFYSQDSNNLLWNGQSAQVVTVANPTGYASHAMVFDAAAAGCVRVAGQETLVFRVPQGWTLMSRSYVFSLSSYALAVDPHRHRLVLQGGTGQVGNSSSSAFDATWLFNGAYWSLIVDALPGIQGLTQHAMVFDTRRDAFVMFGGRRNAGGITDRTFVLDARTAPASYTVFGAGCAGTAAAAPQLQADPLWSGMPTLGGAFFARVDRLAAGQMAFGVFGVSDQVWNQVPLPLDLGVLGMPQCQLLVAPAGLLALGPAGSAGSCSWLLRIPSQQELLGAEFWQQAAVLAPGANAAGVLWSNAGHGVVGIR